MRINIRTPKEMEKMIVAGNKLGAIFDQIKNEIKPGVSTDHLDKVADRLIRESNGIPNFSLVDGYYNAICASVNEVLIHGVPSKSKILKEGDIVSIDMGNKDQNGYNGDACRTFAVGNVSDEAKLLIRCTEECFYEALKVCQVGRHLHEISQAFEYVVSKYGYSLVEEYGGHGIGTDMHEDPLVPNFYKKGYSYDPILKEGMCLAIEPMVLQGSKEIINSDEDGWSVISKDGKLTAHYENDVIITKKGPIITTVDSNVKRHLDNMEECE